MGVRNPSDDESVLSVTLFKDVSAKSEGVTSEVVITEEMEEEERQLMEEGERKEKEMMEKVCCVFTVFKAQSYMVRFIILWTHLSSRSNEKIGCFFPPRFEKCCSD